MTPETYNFTGDAITVLGAVGVISAFIIVTNSFHRFFNSPYNVRVKTQTNTENTEIYTEIND